jgi:hypothetical protein
MPLPGCARAVSMPGASSPLEGQPLSSANFRVQIRDLPSIPDYRFSHAKGFSPARIPDKTVFKPSLEHRCQPATLCGFRGHEITSDPDGAEIFLDDKIIGTTPATLRLTEGAHTLILKSEGHADWIRSINILKESTVTVTAALCPI